MNQRRGRLGAEGGLWGAHLAETIVHAPLQRDELAGGDAIGGPRCHHRLGVFGFVEHGQLLHADAHALLPMAARAEKSHAPVRWKKRARPSSKLCFSLTCDVPGSSFMPRDCAAI